MPNSPSIISLGKLCMLEGFSLHWERGQTPYLLDPSDQRIELEVDRFVPHITSSQLDAVRSSNASPLSPSKATTAGVDSRAETPTELAMGAIPNEPGTGSSEDPTQVPPPPVLQEVVEDESDADSIDSEVEATSPNMSEREK